MYKLCHAHLPWRHIETYLPFILENNLQPEVAFKGPDLDSLDIGTLERTATSLRQAGLSVTVHAPFADLNPGAMEPLVFEATLKRYRQTLDVAKVLGARLVVFHPGFDHWKYGGNDHLWHEQNLRFWPPLLRIAEECDCRMALENIYEATPVTLAKLLDEIDSPFLGHCFDVGHWNLFSKISLQEWFASLGHHTLHLHLHDNDGKADQHLPVGSGGIDFAPLLSLVKTFSPLPTMTLEAHDPDSLLQSMRGVSSFLQP